MAAYDARVSRPILDRLDLQVEVPTVAARELRGAAATEDTATVAARVAAARSRQRARGFVNAALAPARLREWAALDAAGERLVRDAVDRGGFSARGVDRALRVARTIADLAGDEQVAARQVAEALQYRAYESRRAAPV